MKKLISLLLIWIMMLGITPAALAAERATIYIAAASIYQTYSEQRSPLTGIGQKLGEFMPETITISNHAMSGRSSKSFIVEGRLEIILNQIRKGDYLIVSFAHNDQSADEYLSTQTETTYKEYLKQYVDGARKKGATAILVSAMERRRFDKNGKALQTLADRAQAMKEVAEEEGVPYVDLQEETFNWWNYLGPEKTKEARGKGREGS